MIEEEALAHLVILLELSSLFGCWSLPSPRLSSGAGEGTSPGSSLAAPDIFAC